MFYFTVEKTLFARGNRLEVKEQLVKLYLHFRVVEIVSNYKGINISLGL